MPETTATTRDPVCGMRMHPVVSETGKNSDETLAPLTVSQATADEAALRAGLAILAGLVTDGIGLNELLTRVAESAVLAIPGADGVGVTVLRTDPPGNRVEALAASAAFVSEIDAIQYEVLDEGPSITAAREQRTVRCGSLGGEALWPRFGPRVGRLGVHSVLSLPLLLPGHVVGAIEVYARAKDVFDEHAAQLGELFAAPAAVAVHNARVLSQARALAVQLQAALATRPVIDQAIGLLLGRTGGTAEEAFARLRHISQSEHTKLAVVAQRIVDVAVRRARARRTISRSVATSVNTPSSTRPYGSAPTPEVGAAGCEVAMTVRTGRGAAYRSPTRAQRDR